MSHCVAYYVCLNLFSHIYNVYKIFPFLFLISIGIWTYFRYCNIILDFSNVFDTVPPSQLHIFHILANTNRTNQSYTWFDAEVPNDYLHK